MAADPKTSAGARLERAAFRSYLRRQLKANNNAAIRAGLSLILDWVEGRQRRYEKKPGGLGRK